MAVDTTPLTATAQRSAAEQVQRARDIVGGIRARSVQGERERHLPVETVEAFTRAGLVRTLQPSRFGGFELPFSTAFDVGIQMGYANGSAGWCLSYFADHAYLVALYNEQAQHEVWDTNQDARVATSFAPAGTVKRAEGGYVLNGTWPWASGINHSHWIILGGLDFPPEGGAPTFLLSLVPKAEVAVEDVWYAAGLKGTGSDNVTLKDVFVPRHLTVDMALMREGNSPGAETNQHPMYRVPIVGVYQYALLGPAIGAARAAYEHLRDYQRTKVHRFTGQEVAGLVPTQIRLSTVEADISIAELLVRRVLEVVERWEGLSLEQRVQNRRDMVYAMRVLVRGVDEMMFAAGATNLYDDSPVQRGWRDVHAIAAHVAMNYEAAAENFGRTALGLPINPHDPFF